MLLFRFSGDSTVQPDTAIEQRIIYTPTFYIDPSLKK
jgi:hypothetical protein